MKIFVSNWYNNFFEDVYSFVKAKNMPSLDNTILIFSTSRARQIAIEYFQENEKNTLLPEILTVQEFLKLCYMAYLDTACATSKALDKLESIVLLYEIVQELAKKEEKKEFYTSMLEFELENTSIQRKELESFQHFYSYGQYLDAIIQECFEEDSMALSLSNIGDNVDGFALYLLSNLREIINAYKNHLEKKNLSTVSYKKYKLAQKLKKNPPSIFEGKRLYFCGLDRITGTEDICFRYFAHTGSDFLISSDIRLAENIADAHWSTSFYQDWAKAWQADFAFIENNSPKPKQEFFFHQGFDTHSQFQDFKIEDASVSNACVLNSPQSLLPLLHSLNPHFEAEELNITMGYPLLESKVFQFFNIMTSFKDRARMYVNENMEENIYINYNDFINFTSFSLFEIPLNEIKKEFLEARNGEELPYINIADIVQIFSLNQQLANKLARIIPLLTDWYNIHTLENLVNFIIKLEKLLHDKVQDKNIEKLAFKRLNEILFVWRQKTNILLINMGYELCLKLFFESIKDESIPFEHHSNKAIQVLGLRETRLLSFNTIHIFDANDEYLPPKREENPLLPDNLRFHLGLKSSKMYELYTAHTWHRLVASSKNVHFYWQESSAKGLFDSKKTRSPYVEEALWELERQKGEIIKPNGKELTQAKCIIELPQRELSIPVSDNLKEVLLDFCKKPLSATRLDTFLACPLKFFYQYISGIKTISEPKEEDNQRVIGNLVHGFMEALYPEENTFVETNTLMKRYEKEIKNFDKYLEKDKLYDILPAESMLLLKNSFPNKMQKFILSQPEQTKILAKEKKLEVNLLLKEKYSHCVNMKLQGVIDRIDERINEENTSETIILDYKTGSLTRKLPNKTFWKNEDLFQNIEQNVINFDENIVKNIHNDIFNGIKSVQLPFYIFLTNNNNYSILNAAYVDFYETCTEKSIISKDNDIDKIINTQLPLLLEFLMLYMQSITSFTRIKNAPCAYCDYKKYCE